MLPAEVAGDRPTRARRRRTPRRHASAGARPAFACSSRYDCEMGDPLRPCPPRREPRPHAVRGPHHNGQHAGTAGDLRLQGRGLASGDTRRFAAREPCRRCATAPASRRIAADRGDAAGLRRAPRRKWPIAFAREIGLHRRADRRAHAPRRPGAGRDLARDVLRRARQDGGAIAHLASTEVGESPSPTRPGGAAPRPCRTSATPVSCTVILAARAPRADTRRRCSRAWWRLTSAPRAPGTPNGTRCRRCSASRPAALARGVGARGGPRRRRGRDGSAKPRPHEGPPLRRRRRGGAGAGDRGRGLPKSRVTGRRLIRGPWRAGIALRAALSRTAATFAGGDALDRAFDLAPYVDAGGGFRPAGAGAVARRLARQPARPGALGSHRRRARRTHRRDLRAQCGAIRCGSLQRPARARLARPLSSPRAPGRTPCSTSLRHGRSDRGSDRRDGTRRHRRRHRRGGARHRPLPHPDGDWRRGDMRALALPTFRRHPPPGTASSTSPRRAARDAPAHRGPSGASAAALSSPSDRPRARRSGAWADEELSTRASPRRSTATDPPPGRSRRRGGGLRPGGSGLCRAVRASRGARAWARHERRPRLLLQGTGKEIGGRCPCVERAVTVVCARPSL